MHFPPLGRIFRGFCRTKKEISAASFCHSHQLHTSVTILWVPNSFFPAVCSIGLRHAAIHDMWISTDSHFVRSRDTLNVSQMLGPYHPIVEALNGVSNQHPISWNRAESFATSKTDSPRLGGKPPWLLGEASKLPTFFTHGFPCSQGKLDVSYWEKGNLPTKTMH